MKKYSLYRFEIRLIKILNLINILVYFSIIKEGG